MDNIPNGTRGMANNMKFLKEHLEAVSLSKLPMTKELCEDMKQSQEAVQKVIKEDFNNSRENNPKDNGTQTT